MDSWDLTPTEEQIRENMLPNGLTSWVDAERAALRNNIVVALSEIDTDYPKKSLRALVTILQACFEGGIL